MSKIVFFEDDDLEAKKIMYIFNSLKFEYTAMVSKPTGYNYLKAKDFSKWQGYKPRDIIPLIDRMFQNFSFYLK